LRRTPVEVSSDELTTGYRMLDPLGYQLRPASLALQNLQPRILVADAVGLENAGDRHPVVRANAALAH
jgi:hypothetical protein